MPKTETAKQDSKPSQKPTIGRIVHFLLDSPEEPMLCPALVIGVYPDDDSLVDLLVALPYGHASGHLMQRPRVRFGDSGEVAANTWSWPARA